MKRALNHQRHKLPTLRTSSSTKRDSAAIFVQHRPTKCERVVCQEMYSVQLAKATYCRQIVQCSQRTCLDYTWEFFNEVCFKFGTPRAFFFSRSGVSLYWCSGSGCKKVVRCKFKGALGTSGWDRKNNFRPSKLRCQSKKFRKKRYENAPVPHK